MSSERGEEEKIRGHSLRVRTNGTSSAFDLDDDGGSRLPKHQPVTPRNTRTGNVLERMVLPALDNGGYAYRVQVNIGQRLGCGTHFVDVIAEKNERRLLISMKWQQVSGTAEQKVAFEVICLLDALEAGSYQKAYLVLGGEGWTLRNFYISGGLGKYLKHDEKVEILTLESFVARANTGKL